MSRGGVGGAGRGGGGLGDGDGSRGGGGGGIPVGPAVPLPLVDLGVPLALVAAGELASTLGAGERLLPGVRADVCGQVVTAAEAAHADAALERLLARVHTHVPRQLVRAGEAAVAAVGGAGVRALVRRRLALPACRLPVTTGLGELGLEGGSLRLGLDLGGEGFDCGEGCEGGLLCWQQVQRFLLLIQAELSLLLRQEVIREHRHHQGGRLEAEPRGGGGVGRRGAL